MTYEEALDAMYATFSAAWSSGAAAVVGYVPEVRREGVANANAAPLDKVYASFYVRNAVEDQATLGTPVGPGTHDYESVGLLVICIHGPKDDDASIGYLRKLATLVTNAYRRAGGEVWYREVTRRERDPDERWYKVDVQATYEFRETV